MADSPSLNGADTQSRGFRLRGARLVLGALGIAAVLALGLYFTLSSGAFLKAVVLPRVGAALKAQISVGEISLSPFSRLELSQLKVETVGPQPLFQAERVLVRYRLFSLLFGRFEFPEIVAESPQLSLVQQADGKTNLDPLLEPASTSAPATKRSKPLQVNIGAITLSKGLVRFSRLSADGASQTSEIGDLSVDVADVANEKEGRLKFEATFGHTASPAAGARNGVGRLQGNLSGSFTARLLKDLQPEVVRGEARLQVGQASGSLADLAGLIGTLGCDVSGAEVRDVSARFERAGQSLGTLRIRGPFELARSEARLTLEVTSIDRHVLNLAGAPFGLDFLDTKISATTTLDVSRGGDTVGATGRGTIAKLSVRQHGMTNPPVDLDLNYHFTLNLGDKSAVLHKLALTGQQEGRALLNATLDRPMYLAWGELPQGINESDIRIAVQDLHLGEWGAILGTNAPTGTLDLTNKITCQLDGRKFLIEVGGRLRDLAWAYGGQRMDRGDLQFQTTGTFSDYRAFLLDKYSVRLSEQEVPLVAVSGSAGYDLSSGDVNVQLVLEAGLPEVLSQFPVPNLKASAGRISVDALLGQDRGQHRASLNLNLSGFEGTYESYRFQAYDARSSADVELTSQNLTLRRLQLTFRQGVGSFGGLDLTGKYDRMAGKGEFALNIDSLTESGLQPFLAPFLAPRRLASAQISGTGTLVQDGTAGSTLKLQTELKGMRFEDPDGMVPEAPFDFQVQCEAGYRSNVVQLTQLVVALPPTPRAGNQVLMQGSLTLVPTNAMTGQLKITGEALDLSGIVDAYLTNRPTAAPVSAGTGGSSAGEVEEELGPYLLPIGEFTTDLKIDRVYAKTAVFSNWVATAKLASNVVVLSPFGFVANGAPVTGSGKIDLARAGLGYEASMEAGAVPLAPLVEAFAPDREGQIQGELDARIQLTGSGTTGPNWTKNLAGAMEMGTTNLNLALGDVRSKVLKSLINVIVGIPELVRNPGSALGNLVGQLTGGNRGETGGWVDEFAKSPIQVIAARAKAGQGRVEFEQARVQSAAFVADALGTVTLAPAWTNSTIEIPVQVALRRPLAEGVGLVSPGAATNETYVKLPDFLTMQGTLGEPKSKLNTVALVAVAAKAGAGLIGNTGNAGLDKAAGVLDAVGGLFGSGGGTSTNRTATNAPAALMNAVGNLLGTGGASSTNQPGTNAPAGQTNRSVLPINPLDLFKRK